MTLEITLLPETNPNCKKYLKHHYRVKLEQEPISLTGNFHKFPVCYAEKTCGNCHCQELKYGEVQTHLINYLSLVSARIHILTLTFKNISSRTTGSPSAQH